MRHLPLLALLGLIACPTAALAGHDTSPCSKGLEAQGYVVRDVDNNGWYDEIDVTDSKGQRLELDVRRSDCLIMHQENHW